MVGLKPRLVALIAPPRVLSSIAIASPTLNPMKTNTKQILVAENLWQPKQTQYFLQKTYENQRKTHAFHPQALDKTMFI